jgi:peptide deformylase
MTVRSVLRMGEPLLLQRASEITAFDTPELHALIKDMEDTMINMQGAGLAAPQIGVGLRLVIFGQKDGDDRKNLRYPDAHEVPYTILLNPKLTFIGDEKQDGWEGCLSVPGLRGVVPRYTKLHYTGFDPYGNPIDRIVSGFHARVVQHECDHLDGILYPTRMTDLTTFGYVDVIFPNQSLP